MGNLFCITGGAGSTLGENLKKFRLKKLLIVPQALMAYTPLHQASEIGDFDEVQRLIDRGFDVNIEIVRV